jgi:ribonuclease HII
VVSHPPDLSREQGLWATGYRWIGGVDEAGRGAWAGPVVAAAVILPPDLPDLALLLAPVRDSKQLTPRCREACFALIVRHAISYGIGSVPAQEIDRLGILQATRLAMRQAVESLQPPPEYLLIDAVPLPEVGVPYSAIVKGDRDCLSIAAASIIAKVTRDRWMMALEERLPGYGLGRHKGYGTRAHWEALRRLGPSEQHRRSFAPIRALGEV